MTTASDYGPKHVKASQKYAHVSCPNDTPTAVLIVVFPCKTKPICDPPSFRESPITLLKYLVSSFAARERQFTAHTESFFKNGRGYSAEQATKPQTLGFSLADSPIGPGLFARITRNSSRGQTRIRAWTDDEVALTPTLRLSQVPNLITELRFVVLTWVSIYWLSRAEPAASIRIYSELALAGQVVRLPKTTVPVDLSYFPKDFVQFPRVCIPTIPSSVYLGLMMRESSWLRAQAKIVFESEHEVGEHFAAYEQPEALVGDLRKMFGKSGPAASVVSGCTG